MTVLLDSLTRAGHQVDVLIPGPNWLPSLRREGLDNYYTIECQDPDDYKNKIDQCLDSGKYDYFFPSWTDVFTLTAVAASERNCLPAITSQAAQCIETKDTYYKIFEQLDIPCPRVYQLIEPDAVLDTVPDNVQFPCVAKPSHAVSKPGMQILENPAELVEFFSEQSQKHNTQYNPRGKPYMLQEYIAGDVFSIMGHVVDGRVTIDFCYDIESDCAPYAAETGCIFPSKQDTSLLIPYIDRFFKHLGINNTIWMFDLIRNQDNVYFIDFGARAPTNPQLLVKYSGEEDYAAKLMDCLFNRKEFVLNNTQAVIWRQIKLPAGLLESLECSRPDLAEELYLPQEAIWSPTSDYEVHRNPYAVIVADTLEQAEQKFFDLVQSIVVKYKVQFKDHYSEIFWKKQCQNNNIT